MAPRFIPIGISPPLITGSLVTEHPLAKYLPNTSTWNEDFTLCGRVSQFQFLPGYLLVMWLLHIIELIFRLSWLTCKMGEHFTCLKAGGVGVDQGTRWSPEVPSNSKKIFDSGKYISFQGTEMGKRNNLIADTKEPRCGLEYIRKLQQPRGKYKDKNIKGRTQGRKEGWPSMT